MTEKQAWLYIAKLWENPKISPCGTVCFSRDKHELSGLCGNLEMLFVYSKISYDTYHSMRRKIQSVRKTKSAIAQHGINTNYKWPTNIKGAKMRLRFCKKQASLLDK